MHECLCIAKENEIFDKFGHFASDEYIQYIKSKIEPYRDKC